MEQMELIWSLKTWCSFPGGADIKASGCNVGDLGSIPGFDPWVRKIPWRRKRQPTPVFLPGESHGRRSLVGYSPQVAKSWTRLSRTRLSNFNRCIHISPNDPAPSLSMAEYYSTVCIFHVFFIHSSVGGHLGWFHVLAIVNSAAVRIGAPVSVWIMVFSGHMPRCRICVSFYCMYSKVNQLHIYIHFIFFNFLPI